MEEQQVAEQETEQTTQEQQTEQQEQAKEDPWAKFEKPEGFDEKYVDIDRFNKVYGKMKHFERELQERHKPQKEEPQPIGTRPRLENFDSQEAYEDAVADWRIEQREQKSNQARQQQTVNERNSAFDQKMARGFTKYADFQDTAYGDMPLSQMTVEVLKDFSGPEDIVYFLGKNPQIARNLYSLQNPIQIARELTKIEAELAKPQQRTRSKAPDPVETIGEREKPLKGLEDMTYDEYKAYMDKKQFGKK